MPYCSVTNPATYHGCTRELDHDGPHQEINGETWVVASYQPAVPAPISEARTVARHEQEMRAPDKLTVFDSLPVPPTKEEILTAISGCTRGVASAYRAVEKLFEERGL
jgi:hypothetical protein